MKNILIVVDYQKDFYDPNGSLYVKGGEKLLPNILNIIPNFDHVIFTVDWHPTDHISFRGENAWPVHCVQYTEGASLPLELIIAANSYDVYRKAQSTYIEEYGAFNENALGHEAEIITGLHRYNKFVVCGIAGDYCVKRTIMNLCQYVPLENISLYLDGIVNIDNNVFDQFLAVNKFNIYDYK